MMGMPWEKVDVTWGDTGKNLPWTCVSGGSQTAPRDTRAAHAAATDAIKKLQEIAAKTHGGQPDEYVVAERARLRPRRQHDAGAGGAEGDRARRQVRRPRSARRTSTRSQGVGGGARGSGADGRRARHLSARRRDAFVRRRVRGSRSRPRDREVPHRRLPRGRRRRHRHPSDALGGQVLGRSMLGIGHAIGQHWVYDQHYGVPLAKRFYQNKPPTILDAPQKMAWDALEHRRS